jgi:hypothetical protein
MTYVPAANSIRWLSFRNQSEEPIPGFAVLRPTGVITVEGQAVLTVAQPNSSGGGFHLFNGPFPVAAGGFGSCTVDFPCFAAYDTADVPALGEEWGPQAGSWALTKGNTGYRILGGAQDGRVEITSSHPSSALVHFYLNADLARGHSQFAQVLEWNGTIWLPGAATIEVFDSSKIGPATATQLGVCYLSGESHRYEIISLEQTPSDLVLFYLNVALPRGGSASAQRRQWTGVAWSPGGEPPLTVHDSSRLGPAGATNVGVAWLNPDSNRYEVISLEHALTALRWAKATTKWTNLPANGSYVLCHKALDKAGTLDLDEDEEPQDITVYLPRPGGMVDPNVRSGDVIGYEVDDNGLAIAVTGYLDDKIGTVKMWVGQEEDVQGGWRIYGPSPGRFPVGVTTSDEDIPATAPGATGGEKKHTHDGWYTEEADVVIANHTGLETQPTEIDVLPHIGFYTEEAYVTVLEAGATTAYLSGETEEATAPIIGSGVVAVSGTGTANTSSVSLTTQSGGGGSAGISGTTGSNTTGITIVGAGTHNHQVTMSGGSAQSWTSGAALLAAESPVWTTSDGNHTHGVTDLGHTHSLTGTVTVSSHTHDINAHSHQIVIADIAEGLSVDGAEIAALLMCGSHSHGISELEVTIPGHYHDTSPHIHALPTMMHSVWPNPHNHGIDPITHDVDPHYHLIPEPPQAKHIPPFFGIHFIERYE